MLRPPLLKQGAKRIPLKRAESSNGEVRLAARSALLEDHKSKPGPGIDEGGLIFGRLLEDHKTKAPALREVV